MKQFGIMVLGPFYTLAGQSIGTLIANLFRTHPEGKWPFVLGLALVANLLVLPPLYKLSRQLNEGPQSTMPEGDTRGEQFAKLLLFGHVMTNRIAFLVFVICYLLGLALPFLMSPV